ncbi:MAG: plasmid mobilization relaxosome protein MobC [Methylotenera sp.]
MARPEKLDAEKLTKSVAFRMTEGTFKMYERKFMAAGLKQSEFFRLHVVNNTTQVVAKSPAASRAVLLLSKASNNLNQLAHRANAANLSRTISDETFKTISTQLKLLNEFMMSQVKEANQ